MHMCVYGRNTSTSLKTVDCISTHIFGLAWVSLLKTQMEKKHQLQHMSSHAHVEKVNAHLVVLRCIHRLNQNRTWAAHNVASPCCFGFLFGTPSPQARGCRPRMTTVGNGGKWHMRRTTFPVWGVPFYLWLIHRGHEQTARRGLTEERPHGTGICLPQLVLSAKKHV